MKNKFIIIQGMTNSGKTTLLNYICETTNITPIISFTTRPKRPSERQGIEYNFITKDIMKEMIENNEFIELREYHTLVDNKPDIWYYGVAKEEYQGDKIVILDIQGTKDFVNYYGEENCSVFYLDVPITVLKDRSIIRGDYNESEFNRRLKDDMRVFNDIALESVKAIKISSDTIENMAQKVLENIK